MEKFLYKDLFIVIKLKIVWDCLGFDNLLMLIFLFFLKKKKYIVINCKEGKF